MRRTWWIPVALLAAGLAAAAAGEKGKTEKEIGLSPTSVFEATVPEAAGRTEAGPGESEAVPRPYPGAPPVISHAVEDFLPITRDENACVLCHGDPDMGAPVMPEDHYRDLRNAPDRKRDEIAGARQPCLACHVVLTDAKPLVEMRFAPPASRSD